MKRTTRQDGFTLIELLTVLVILGILLSIAVPSYLGFKDRASKAAAEANVRSAVPAVAAYYADNNTYAGMDSTSLLTYDVGLKAKVDPSQGNTTTYCIYSQVGNFLYYERGPGGAITPGTSGSTNCT